MSAVFFIILTQFQLVLDVKGSKLVLLESGGYSNQIEGVCSILKGEKSDGEKKSFCRSNH